MHNATNEAGCWEPLLDCGRALLQLGNNRQASITMPVVPETTAERGAGEAWPKKIFLVRHGESTFNKYYQEFSMDPMNLWDAPLTATGEAQARSLVHGFDALQPIELVVTSPLTRAAQTCLLALPASQGGCRNSTSRRYEVNALLAESLGDSCDFGRPPKELAVDFPELSFGDLPEVWWYVPEEYRQGITPARSRELFTEMGRRESIRDFESRVDEFARFLAGRSERTIALFGHCDYFNTLLRRHFAAQNPLFEDYWMQNCEILTIEVSGPEELLASPNPE